MKITFITIFENYINIFKEHSIIKNAIKKKKIEIEIVNPRNFTKNGKVDDYVYGGGSGMLLLIEPIVKAINSVKKKESKVYLLGPRGKKHNQENAKKLAKEKHLILVSGNYEGVDARIKYYIDGEISIGNFIVTSGEMPAMLLADSIVRLIDGVIKRESYMNETFENGLLEYDNYSRPKNFENHLVPNVLLSGDHQKIQKWREKNAIKNTMVKIIKKEK